MINALLLAVGLLAGSSWARTPEEAPSEALSAQASSHALVDKARKLYFTGDVLTAAKAFETAIKVSSGSWRDWADGAVAWAEAGHPKNAIAWQRRAAALHGYAESRAELGWTLLRADEPKAAYEEFSRALASDPKYSNALLGAGRAMLALGNPAEAVEWMSKAEPGQALVDYYLGEAYEKLGDKTAAAKAYTRAVSADSYFNEGRAALTRNYVLQRRYDDAWRQLRKLVEADPGSKFARAMLGKIRPLLSRSTSTPPDTEPRPVEVPSDMTEAWKGKIPFLRIGVSSTGMGRPRARRSATIRGSGDWNVLDTKTGRILLTAQAGDAWTIRLIPAKWRKKKKIIHARLEFRSPNGKVAAVPRDSVRLVPLELKNTVLALVDDPANAQRAFRGELELSLFRGGRTIRIVNIVGLEDYTHGVVSAEMPQRAPFEALKAQAVIARTHAMYIKTMTRRHRREGYDLCDGQHCQVYGGLRAETERTRAVVIETRGRVATWQGKPAHVIYSSHCGGRTQSGTDIGWGAVPYWKSVADTDVQAPPPASPLDLRAFLSDWPQGFDRPSSYVHPAHARWTRAIPVKELQDKLNRKFGIGRLLGLRVLRRVPSGHVKTLLILGSRKNKKLTDEMSIRSLLGIGSLRSTMFIMDTEYLKQQPPTRRPAKGKKAVKPASVLVPKTFVFRGGGWGHAVGLCQSGAMGRAEAGQSYEEIVKAYFLGVEIGRLGY